MLSFFHLCFWRGSRECDYQCAGWFSGYNILQMVLEVADDYKTIFFLKVASGSPGDLFAKSHIWLRTDRPLCAASRHGKSCPSLLGRFYFRANQDSGVQEKRCSTPALPDPTICAYFSRSLYYRISAEHCLVCLVACRTLFHLRYTKFSEFCFTCSSTDHLRPST